jgi:PAS domain S-box-containing protein
MDKNLGRSEKKEIQIRWRERHFGNERIFRAVFDQSFQFMGLLTPDGTLVAANRASLEFIQREEAEVLGLPFWLTPWWTHSPQQQKRLQEALRRVAQGQTVRFETTHPDASGRVHYVDFSLRPITDDRGRVFLLVPEGRDITDRWEAENNIRDSEEKYRLLFSAESDAILIFDAETFQIVEANDAAALLYGYAREEFSRLHFTQITAEPENLRERIDRVLEGKLNLVFVVQHRRKNGELFPAEISLSAFHWKERPMIIQIIRDISERLKIATLKDEMLSAVSHEMRTPLTAMLGFTEFMLENEIPPEQMVEYIAIIHKESERLKGLIDNLLTFQSLRAGFGIQCFRAVVVPPLLHQAAHLFERCADHRFTISVPDNLPPILGDEERILQALENLVSNACKYSPACSGIEIGADFSEDAITIWVRDEGPGIPPEAQGQIFDRFFRIDNKDGRRIGGTGLGLPLVKEIVKLHDGQVWVESAPGLGSTFLMRLPLDKVCWLH